MAEKELLQQPHARRVGRCTACGERYKVGDPVWYFKGETDKAFCSRVCAIWSLDDVPIGKGQQSFHQFFHGGAAKVAPAQREAMLGVLAVRAAQLLGCPVEAPYNVQHAAFRRAAMVTHSDRGGKDEAMAKLNAAWGLLQAIHRFKEFA